MYYPEDMTAEDIRAFELDMSEARIWEEMTDADRELMLLLEETAQ